MSGIRSTHNIFAFVQARTGSTRLPKKVLRTFLENPDRCILDLILERLEFVLPKERICLLIPEGDEPLKHYALNQGILFFEGSELDVRQRFIDAANQFQPDWVLRLTADNPFLDLLHLELLLEASRFSNADVISFSGLPIGTSGEIIKASSISLVPKTGLEDRHREHVSLHLKEFPEEFWFLKLSPFLSQEEQKLAGQIRLTIDETKDWETCRNVWNSLSSPIFGTTEILRLFKMNPKLFLENKDVKQVSFPLPEPRPKHSNKIVIVYAPVAEHGSGHFSRMRLLRVYLESLGFSIQFTDEFLKDDFHLGVLDYRETEIPPSMIPDKWVKLDNFGNVQGQETFFYSLPQPQLDLNLYKDNFLFSGSLERAKEINVSLRIGVFYYAGGLDRKSSDYLDLWVSEQFPNQPKFRVGGTKPTRKDIGFAERLSAYGFYQKINQSQVFISYFGQSLFEAYYLGVSIYSYSISHYHEELSVFAEACFGIPHLGNVFYSEFLQEIPDFQRKVEISGMGFTKVLETITSKLGEKHV
jgi:spore coat polysaccharide biosynthesis protein SpsF